MAIGPQMDADHTAQDFWETFRKSDANTAYGFFSEQLITQVPLEKLTQFIQSLENEWGKLESAESVIMPFHTRPGEKDFIPPNVSNEEVKRYVYDLKFEHASVNGALSLIPQGDQYKITWFSFWGSDSTLTPELRHQMDDLFGRVKASVTESK